MTFRSIKIVSGYFLTVILLIMGATKPGFAGFYQDNSISIEWLSRLIGEPEQAEIELVTIVPGQEIYTRFGHTLLRVRQRGSYDLAYNFGVFDFSDPSFVWNYTRGFLRYRLIVIGFSNIMKLAEKENRTLYTIPLNLKTDEKRIVLAGLRYASRPENQFYTYNYFTNNCATRIRDLLDTATNGALRGAWSKVMTNWTHRRALHAGLAPFPAANYFLDVGLNATTDEPLSSWDASFLPFAFADLVASEPILGGRFLGNVMTIHRIGRGPVPEIWFSPTKVQLAIFAAFALLWIAVGRRGRWERQWPLAVWGLYSGLLSVLLLTIWLGTAHGPFQANSTLLLVWPFDLLLVSRRFRQWLLVKRRLLGQSYLLLHAIVSCCYLFGKFFVLLPQDNWQVTIGASIIWLVLGLGYLKSSGKFGSVSEH